MDALNAKIAATQQAIQAENELRKAQAEAQKAIAKAEGEAKANELLAKSISTSLIQWRQLENTQQAIAKWNGKAPEFWGGSGSGFMFNIPFNQPGPTPVKTP